MDLGEILASERAKGEKRGVESTCGGWLDDNPLSQACPAHWLGEQEKWQLANTASPLCVLCVSVCCVRAGCLYNWQSRDGQTEALEICGRAGWQGEEISRWLLEISSIHRSRLYQHRTLLIRWWTQQTSTEKLFLLATQLLQNM